MDRTVLGEQLAGNRTNGCGKSHRLLKRTRHLSKRRQKVSRACDACKQRKAKCSGTVPCVACVARQLPCLYETHYSRGRPPTPTPAHLSPPTTDNSALRRAGRRPSAVGESGILVYDGNISQLRDSPDARLSSVAPGGSRGSPELESAEVQGQLLDPTSGLAFLDRAWKKLSSQQRRGSVIESPRDTTNAYQKQIQRCAGDKPFDKGDNGLLHIPDRKTAKDLVTLYFDVCIATYRFLHRPTIHHWLDQLLRNVEESQPITRGIGELKVSIVLTVLAIAIFHQGKSKHASSSDDAGLALRRSDRLFKIASQLANDAKGYPDIHSVQAKLIHTLYLLHSSRVNQAWFVFGDAVQIVAAIGLHRKTQRGRSMASGAANDYISVQCRLRAFWVAYTLDTYLGVMLGRPRHYHDESIDQDFPDAVDDEDMSSSGPTQNRNITDSATEAVIFHAKIAQIVAKTSARIYSVSQPTKQTLRDSVEEIDTELEEWRESLPPLLGSVNPASLVAPFRRQSIALRLAYCHAIMHANRPFLLPENKSRGKLGHYNTVVVSRCLSAAHEVLEMVDSMACDGTLFHAFWWTHYVTFCSLTIVYVWAIESSTSKRSKDEETERILPAESLFDLAERCKVHLAEATASSSPSRRYSIILDELRGEALARMPDIKRGFDSMVLDQRSSRHTDVANLEESLHQEHAALELSHIQPELNDQVGDLWDGLQSFDWLDIDSLAFGPFLGVEQSPQSLTQHPDESFTAQTYPTSLGPFDV